MPFQTFLDSKSREHRLYMQEKIMSCGLASICTLLQLLGKIEQAEEAHFRLLSQRFEGGYKPDPVDIKQKQETFISKFLLAPRKSINDPIMPVSKYYGTKGSAILQTLALYQLQSNPEAQQSLQGLTLNNKEQLIKALKDKILLLGMSDEDSNIHAVILREVWEDGTMLIYDPLFGLLETQDLSQYYYFAKNDSLYIQDYCIFADYIQPNKEYDLEANQFMLSALPLKWNYPSPLDVSQNRILEAIRDYLQQRQKKHGISVSTEYFNAFKEGFCYALSVLRGFSYLITVLSSQLTQRMRDDAPWFDGSIEKILCWNRKDPDEIAEIIEPFIAKLFFLQHTNKILPQFSFNNLHETTPGDAYHYLEYSEEIEDDVGKKFICIGHLEKEDAFIFPFATSHLPDLLDAMLVEDRFILLNTEDHAMTIFKHDHQIIFYDPGHDKGAIFCDSIEELASELEIAVKLIGNPPVLSGYIFRLDKQLPLLELPSNKIHDLINQHEIFKDIKLKNVGQTMWVGFTRGNLPQALQISASLMQQKLMSSMAIYSNLIGNKLAFFANKAAVNAPKMQTESKPSQRA